MEGLSWLFFCLSPFVLFCSESGNGLILCPIFIALGLILRWLNNGCNNGVTVKIAPEKYWETMYLDYIGKTLHGDDYSCGFIAYEDRKAREWATTMCNFHKVWVPPDEIQEQIAKANGIVTEKMNEKRDRIQFGKYYLMEKIIDDYKETREAHTYAGTEWKKISQMINELKFLKEEIFYSNSCRVELTSLFEYSDRFGVSEKEDVWEKLLSQDEKKYIEKWVEECLERLKKEEIDRKNGIYTKRDNEYLKKYEFRI